MDGCRLCNYHGCDDCMFETKVLEYNRVPKQKPHIKKKIIVKPTDLRLKENRGLTIS